MQVAQRMKTQAVGSSRPSASRVAALSPKHVAGRARKALRCQAAMTLASSGSSSLMMGQRLRVASPSSAGQIRRSGGRAGRLSVNAM